MAASFEAAGDAPAVRSPLVEGERTHVGMESGAAHRLLDGSPAVHQARTPITTAEMRRRPPGEPTTAQGAPSRSRIAGAAACSARRPGAGEIRRPGRGSNHIMPLFRGYPSPGTAKADPKRPPSVPVSATAMPSASIAFTCVVQSEVGAPDRGALAHFRCPRWRGLRRDIEAGAVRGDSPAPLAQVVGVQQARKRDRHALGVAQIREAVPKREPQ